MLASPNKVSNAAAHRALSEYAPEMRKYIGDDYALMMAMTE